MLSSVTLICGFVLFCQTTAREVPAPLRKPPNSKDLNAWKSHLSALGHYASNELFRMMENQKDQWERKDDVSNDEATAFELDYKDPHGKYTNFVHRVDVDLRHCHPAFTYIDFQRHLENIGTWAPTVAENDTKIIQKLGPFTRLIIQRVRVDTAGFSVDVPMQYFIPVEHTRIDKNQKSYYIGMIDSGFPAQVPSHWHQNSYLGHYGPSGLVIKPHPENSKWSRVSWVNNVKPTGVNIPDVLKRLFTRANMVQYMQAYKRHMEKLCKKISST
ncbi:unnamed protein product [Cyprideis torosa]|uniref:Uncharacterized protein n=1 Tax=Cyprideis torosa TaxID=163714 RepID=A0A7R8ZPG2_9CRUS|nr:unnamed protein product [Cyprideis torosa]CAG0900477.1 unnamed protein product [Cyprideis torosa]